MIPKRALSPREGERISPKRALFPGGGEGMIPARTASPGGEGTDHLKSTLGAFAASGVVAWNWGLGCFL
jgi:hypothetical protein